VEQAQVWANMVADYYESTPQKQQQQQQQQQRSGRGTDRCEYGLSPRIGILNRVNSRAMENVVQLAEEMQSNIPGMKETDICIAYFENATFVEQVHFFMNTDILISPHGAQLTGIPFLTTTRTTRTRPTATTMTNSCSQVMEVFPSNYVLTDFFGTLAAQSHIPHSYMYFEPIDNIKNDNNSSSSLVLPGTVRISRTVTERKMDRQQSIPILGNDVVQAVQELVDDWYTCCHQAKVRSKVKT
jgi:hypothetical protein